MPNINKVTITINERTFEFFKSITIVDDIELFGKRFELEINVPQDDDFQILINDLIKIDVDGERLMTGFIESFRCIASPDNRAFMIFGRDIIVDFTDSTLPNMVFKTPFNIIDCLKSLLIKNGFTVGVKAKKPTNDSFTGLNNILIINEFGNIPNFTEEDAVQYIKDVGEKSFAYLKKLTNSRGILLGTDAFGNIIIRRVGNEIATTNLICYNIEVENNNINNIKESEVIINFQDSFHRYEIISSSSQGTEGEKSIFINNQSKPEQTSIANDLVERRAIVFDEEVRERRIYTKYIDKNLSLEECKKFATWELNTRKAKRKILKYTVLGFRQNLEQDLSLNQLWRVNQLVWVYDESQYPIIDGEFLIKSIHYRQSLKLGTICEMELVDQLSYSYSISEPLLKKTKDKKERIGRIFIDLENDKRRL